MNKHLFIVRHAQAVSGAAGQRDFDRELSSSGIIEACKMGGHLKKLGVSPDVLFASPAVRALSTAQYMAEQLGYDTERIVINNALYEEYALQSFVEMINAIAEDQKSAMVVAHNPKQTYLAEYFTHDDIGSIPTGGVVHVIFENQRWVEITGGSGKMAWFEYPEKLNSL
ncbi:histidine phosphatase family protein [Cytophagaceae bacterium DM2B3-1]|uniref:Histidine phosphatase family protein n=1 Tax=Xanthocytophaga flava TaxID=3048013 RepID=A0AAE3QRN9_9BACT|nr:histidine phosphatase family protein [Xanthocytophaga flavus]MDJ1470890.1 histidine phosphatase family protein [Xanthocytophaga flavus]MDJ1484080.1 histidine phosphatase family protein [Xanthocytophaga flavus]MDJ1496029.1 histidine phosphatase family protein [Xanthocytophaga flavus]